MIGSFSPFTVLSFSDPSLGTQMYYDPVNIWCEELSKVDCGDRPICDANDQNCQVGLLFSFSLL